jgi:hypothetical protein
MWWDQFERLGKEEKQNSNFYMRISVAFVVFIVVGALGEVRN